MSDINLFYFSWSIIIYLTFFLFFILISIFGFIFFFFIKKINNKKWNLNFLEQAVLSFIIGLSIYITISFILDIFQFFNFYSAYLSIIIVDCFFIMYLIKKKILIKESVLNFFLSIKAKIKKNPRRYLIYICILFLTFLLQFWIQWTLVTSEYAIPSKDTYVWLGQSWYLLEKGYLWRDHMPLHYPKGYTFFLAGPELINPNYRFAYFYFKFGGMCMFSLFLFVLFIILKSIFKKSYLILTGLLLAIISNFLFTRFTTFVSSSLPTLVILISLIILLKKCPFYILGFFISLIFLTNSFFALIFILIISYLVFMNLLTLKKNKKKFFIDYIFKPLLLTSILILPYVIHILIVKNIVISDLFSAYSEMFGFKIICVKYNIININYFNILHPLILREILTYFFPDNSFVLMFLDIERKAFSYYIILTFIILFIPIKRFFNSNFKEILNFGKISLVLVLSFYVGEILFSNISIIFTENLGWFKWRALESLTGPIVILTLFLIEKIVKNGQRLTYYLKIKSKKYNLLLRNTFLSKIIRIENIIVILLLISVFSSVFVHKRIYLSYYFEKDQIDSIFYIKQNVPEDSKILVSDFNDGPNCLYNLLSTYKVYKWDFEFAENTFNETIDYIIEKKIEYILLDYTMINSTELSFFNNYLEFKNLYENDFNIIFEVKIDFELYV